MCVTPRDVVYQPQFDQQLNELVSDIRRVDEFIRGVEWQVCREPHSGQQITANVWAIPLNSPPAGENLIIYYTFDTDHIWFLAIR